MKKLISWNVNGIRACAGKGFEDFFRQTDADVFCIQESKMQEGQLALELPGYHQYWNYAEKKGYSGTAIFTKEEPKSVTLGMGIAKHDQEGRLITLDMGDWYMITAYVPNSQNELKRLDAPNIATIFIGIMVGVLFGSIPFSIPGIPTPMKLGLAGGPLIVAILISRFGYKLGLVTYTKASANMMLREVGIALFLASVGIKSGATFFETVTSGDGLIYMLGGLLITVIPVFIVALLARKRYKMNYYSIIGLVAGASTNPPALAFANSQTEHDAPAVAYSTVYPLTMFLRILTAQLMVLVGCSLL